MSCFIETDADIVSILNIDMYLMHFFVWILWPVIITL